MTELNKISGQKIILDVGGQKFSKSLQTLQVEKESVLSIMIVKQEDGSVFIDRDGTHFSSVLNYFHQLTICLMIS